MWSPAGGGAGEEEKSLLKYFRQAVPLPGGVLAPGLLSWGLRLRPPGRLAAIPGRASGESTEASRAAAAGSTTPAPRYQRPAGTVADLPASPFPFPAAGAKGLGLSPALRSPVLPAPPFRVVSVTVVQGGVPSPAGVLPSTGRARKGAGEQLS